MRILLVTIDCLRADALDKMPNLQKIGEDFVSFDNVYANSGCTTPSVKSFLTSTYPLDNNYMEYDCASFVQVLKEHGYPTSCFHSNPWLTFYKDHFGRGFSKFTDVGPADHLPIAHCSEVAWCFDGWLKEKGLLGQSYFGWLHFMDAHDSVHHSHETETYKKRYFKALQKIDKIIPELVKLGDLVIFTADHGEELGEHGRCGHTHPILSETLLRVPLIIRTDHHLEKLRQLKKKRISLLDLAPTILDLLNLPIPDSFRGQSLLKQKETDDRVIIAERRIPMNIKGELPHQYEKFIRARIKGSRKTIFTINKKDDKVIKVKKEKI